MTVAGLLTGNVTGQYPSLYGGTIVAQDGVLAEGGGFGGGSNGTNWKNPTTIIQVGGAASQTIAGVAGAYIPNLQIASTGGTVTMSGTVDVVGNYTFTSGNLNTTGSTLQFDGFNNGANTITVGSESYYNVTFADYNSNTTINGTMTVTGLLTGNVTGQYPALNRGPSGGTIVALGDVSAVGEGFGGGSNGSNWTTTTAIIQIAGSSQKITGSPNAYIPNLQIASTGVVTLSGTIDVVGNYTFTSGTLIAAGSTLQFDGYTSSVNKITVGSESYNNVTFNNYNSTLTLSGATMNISGTLTGSMTHGGAINSGTLAATPANTFGLPNGFGHGTATIE
jgi:hypothetical protein